MGEIAKDSNSQAYLVIHCRVQVNSLPHNKILDWSKLKAFADDKLNATE